MLLLLNIGTDVKDNIMLGYNCITGDLNTFYLYYQSPRYINWIWYINNEILTLFKKCIKTELQFAVDYGTKRFPNTIAMENGEVLPYQLNKISKLVNM